MPLPTTPMAKLLHTLILEHSIQNIKNIYIFTTRSKRPNCGIKRKKNPSSSQFFNTSKPSTFKASTYRDYRERIHFCPHANITSFSEKAIHLFRYPTNSAHSIPDTQESQAWPFEVGHYSLVTFMPPLHKLRLCSIIIFIQYERP